MMNALTGNRIFRLGRLCLAALGLAAGLNGAAYAATLTAYTSQSDFQTALDQSYTFVDFLTGPLSGSGYVPLTANDPRLLPLGLDIITADTRGFQSQHVQFYPGVQQTQAYASHVPILFNGSGTVSNADDFAVNFVGGANGFGYVSNRIDGGVIEFYAGADLSGPLVGTVAVTGAGGFFGGISDMLFRSARITCDFNGDYTCGVTDLQFGTSTPPISPVPLPATGLLLVGALGGMGLMRRRKAL